MTIGPTLPTARINRRQACRLLAGAAVGWLSAPQGVRAATPAVPSGFQLRYIVASSLYGHLSLERMLPEVRRAGATELDVWPQPHGTQREQIEALGHARFADLLHQHRVKLGIVTRYDLGPFRLREEMAFAQKFGARLLISASGGPAKVPGTELKATVRGFVEKMKPHLDAAAEAGVVIGIENHGNALIQSPDSMRYLAELDSSGRLGIALAPYHLPQEPDLIARLITDLGPKLVHFYAWQHGRGAMPKLSKDDELLQMPGRGPLDFGPILSALRRIHYPGWTSIFMHPFPRGIPILPTAREVTGALNAARIYLEGIVAKL